MSFDIEDPLFVEFLKSAQKHDLRYMLIGGVAVNFHGVNRNTQDLDIWLAPNNHNRDLFIKVLLDLGYIEEEVTDIANEDFTGFFKCSIGEMPFTIDCLTIVHHEISFDEAEKVMIKHNIGERIYINVVDYTFLRDMKLRTHRQKDWQDVSRLDDLNKK